MGRRPSRTSGMSRRNRRFRLLLGLGGPPLARAYPYSAQARQYLAQLRDSDTDEGGISSVGSIQDSLPPAFDATNGATGDGSSKAVSLDTSGINTAFNTGGSVRFHVPVSMIDAYPSATEYFISKSGGWTEWLASGSGYMRSRMPESGDPIAVYTDADARTGVLSDDYIEMVVAWDSSNCWFEVDKLPFTTTRTSPGADSAFDDLYLVGLTSTGGTGDGITMRDASVYTGPISYPANPDYGKFVFFGDSFPVQGAMSSVQAGTSDGSMFWNPGPGYINGGAASTGGNYSSDCCLIAAFFRECFRGGLIPGSSNHNDCESGDSISATLTRATTWFGSNTAQVAVITVGANNVADSSPFDATDKANHESNYKELIDLCVANGCNRVVINTVATLRNDPTFQTSAHDTNIAWWNNTLIPRLKSHSDRVVVADTFSAMGGLTPDTTLFQSGNLHPNLKGQHVYGRTMALALMNSF